MKLLLTVVGLSCCLTVFGQTGNDNTSKLLKEYQRRQRFNSRLQFQRPIYKDSLIKDLKNFYSKEQHPGICYLPQDNMPCLVPDTKDIAPIPNAWSDVRIPFQSNIPNPGLKNHPLTEQPKGKTK